MIISKALEGNFDQMIDIWELSVRSTHDFLLDSDIKNLRKLIRDEVFYTKGLCIEILKDIGEIIGFVGTADANIEMLFISPKYFGKGIGRILLDHAIHDKACNKVDVNEQNPRALKFYQKYGFKVVSRSAMDNQGNPFPILHMELEHA